ncbi:MAG: hypothetical protein AAF333_11780 [Planctomycetota bacterium]
MPIDPGDIPDAEETIAVQEAAAPPRRRKRWWRWPVRLAVAGAMLLLLGVALLPTLLSTSPGTSWVLSKVNQQIPGTIEVDNLKVAWLKGQQLENVRLLDPLGHTVATVDRVDLADVGLVGLLRGSNDFGVVLIEGVHAPLERDATGSVNLDRALGTTLFPRPEPDTTAVQDDSATPPTPTPPAESPRPAETTAPAEKPAPRTTPKPRTRSPRGTLPDDLRLQFALRGVDVSMTGPGIDDVSLVIPEATLTADGPGQLGVTLDATVTQNGDAGQAKMVGTIENLFDAQGKLTLAKAEFDVEGKIVDLPLAALDRLTAGERRLQTFIGPTLDAQVSLQWETADRAALLTVTSEKLNARQGLTVIDDRLVATEESSATLLVTPESWVFLAGDDAAALAEPFRLGLSLYDLNAPRDGQALDFASTTLGVALELLETDAIVLDVADRGRVRIDNALADLTSPAADRRYVFAFTAEVDAFGEAAGKVVAGADLRRGDSGWEAAEADVQMRSLPVPVVEAWLKQGRRLSATFGDSLMLTGKARADGAGGYTLRADFVKASADDDSPGLTGTLTGDYSADGTVSLKSAEGIALTLTPAALEQWLQPVAEAAEVGPSVGLSLPEPSTVTMDLDVQVALRGGADTGFDPRRSRAEIELTLPDTQFEDEWYHRRFPLRNGRIALDAKDLSGPMTATMSFETDAAEAGDTAGRLAADLRINGLWDDAGVLQAERAVVNADVSLQRLPTSVFDALSRQRGYAVAAFGQRLTAKLTAEDLSLAAGGPVTFDVSSESGTVGSLPGRLTPEGVLILESPSTFSLNVTPDLGRLLRFANPVVLPAVASARVPITLTIDNDEFRLPLSDFNWDGFNADVSVLMGEVTIRPNVSPLDKILPSLESFSLISQDKSSLANVSPVTLNIRQGKIGYERMLITIDEVELDFSGTIDLATQTVDMDMALGGTAFAKSRGLEKLEGTIVPIGGSVTKPAVQIDAFISNVATSLLGVPPSNGGSRDLGGLLGDFLRNEAQRQREKLREKDGDSDAETDTTNPEDAEVEEELTPEQAIGGLLGDLLNREIRRAREKRERERAESEGQE